MKLKHNLIIIILFLIISTSCSNRGLYYMYDRYEKLPDAKTEFINVPTEYKLKTGDVIYVDLKTTNEEIDKIFNKNTSQNTLISPGFSVCDTGTVELPVLGIFMVVDKTIYEIKLMIQQKVDQMIIDAIVDVKLISFKVYFLGEISSQGPKSFSEKNLNIIEALSTVGGIPQTGNKKDVIIMRKIPNGHKIYHVDVSEISILESDLFYLQPNDLIYVKPKKSAGFRKAVSDYSLVLSLIATTISTTFIVLNLLNKY